MWTLGGRRIAPVVGLIVTLAASAGLVGLTYHLFTGTGGSQGYVWGSGGPFAVNWDAGFQTLETANPSDGAAQYWHPSTHGGGSSDSHIGGGVLHVRENDTASTSWDNYDNAVGQQGNFPWEDDCGHVVGASPDWTCPRNSYGLRTLAWIRANTTLSVNATFLSQQGTGDYNIIIGIYFYRTQQVPLSRT